MHALKIMALGTLLAVASSAAVAFQEQRQGGASAPAAKEPATQPAGRDAGASFTLPGTGTGKASGTEIKIPGLGSLGVLPKMDFGLELLYGAADGKASEENRAVAPNSDDLQIKGTLRRRF